MELTVIKGGKHMINRYGRTKKMFAACICPTCAHITKVEWDVDADKDTENCKIVVPIIERNKLDKCPSCSSKLSFEDHSFICGENAVSEKLINDFIFNLRKNITDGFSAEVNEIIEKSELSERIEALVENTDVVKNDLQNLKAYLRYAVKVESAVRFYQEYLINLKLELFDNDKKFISDTAKQKNIQRNDAADAKKKIEKLEAKILKIEADFEKYDFEIDVNISKNKRPSLPSYKRVPNPTPPVYPTLKKPGLFNKKKIEEENATLTANYNAQREHYLAECEKIPVIEKKNAELKAKYEKELLDYNEKQKQRKYEIQEKAEILKEEARKEKDLEIEKIREEIATLSKKKHIKKVVNSASLFIQNNIESAEKQLKAAVKARAEFYDYNIIYPKYRNYVAVATFCEYIESGRCSSLEGANGAYNLYETECMNNLIVSQLTVIADKLEDIKQNQILMYREMKNINQNLEKLNDTLKDVVSSINSMAMSMSDMQDYLIDISANTRDIKDTNTKIAKNTAISAHYNEVTAYYTKLNCELTDALGFMVAFK